MKLLLTGTPGPLFGLVDNLMTTLAEAVGRSAPTLYRHDPAVADAAVFEVVRRGELRAVAVIDDPLAALSALVDAGHTPLVAARALTAAAAPLAAWEGAMLMRLYPHTTVGQATEAILGTMGLDVPGTRVIGQDIDGPGVVPRGGTGAATSVGVAGWNPAASLAEVAAALHRPSLAGLSDAAEMRVLAEDVLAPLFATAATGVRRAVTWSRSCLLWGDHPDEKLPRIIDLTGPGRVLAYGPYFHLPAGRWTVRATLAFSPATVGAPFAIELHADGLLGRGRFRPDAWRNCI